MIDSCFGTGTVHWSDDSYACGTYACRGCGHPLCPAKKEVPMTPSNPSNPKPRVTVSIPVSVGGYTGQRDNWEEHAHDYAVSIDAENNIVLKANTPTGRKITIPRSGLESAIEILGSLA